MLLDCSRLSRRHCAILMKATLVVFLASACFKLLIYPAYKSTDFEVHRNWLAITHTHNYPSWYYEDTSKWTLDYPPFFAWFEWLLSQVAVYVDPAIVDINNLEYSSPLCVLFQRCTVILSELVLLYAIIQYCYFKEKEQAHSQDNVTQQRWLLLSFQLLANCGLLMVDHIHFQYNGFLFGFLLLSITRILQGQYFWGAIWFAALLNFKHIFLYIAPVYFIYLVKYYCYYNNWTGSRIKRGCGFLCNFIMLGVVVTTVCALSLGPFCWHGLEHLIQIKERLFPVKRGLCHAYWAPNAWALYSATDVLVAAINKFKGTDIDNDGSMTSGLVGEMQLRFLADVSFPVTILLTLLAMIPALLRLLWRRSTPQDFLHCLVLCAYASFLFGWHVHEKAILMITIPLCLCALEELRYLRIYLVLSVAAHICLFPLLIEAAETPIKVTYFIFFTTISFLTLPEFIQNLIVSSQDTPSTPMVPSTPGPPADDNDDPPSRKSSYGSIGSVLSSTDQGDTAKYSENSPLTASLASHPASNVSRPSSVFKSCFKSPCFKSCLCTCGVSRITYAHISPSFPLTYVDCVLLLVVLLTQLYHYVLYGALGMFANLPFLPLLLTSVSCALVVVWTWLLAYREFFRQTKTVKLD